MRAGNRPLLRRRNCRRKERIYEDHFDSRTQYSENRELHQCRRPAYGGVLEYSYNKGIVNRTAEYLRKAGHRVDVLLCPELQFQEARRKALIRSSGSTKAVMTWL